MASESKDEGRSIRNSKSNLESIELCNNNPSREENGAECKRDTSEPESGMQLGEGKPSCGENGTEFADTSEEKSDMQFGGCKANLGENGTECTDTSQKKSDMQFGGRKASLGENGTEHADTSQMMSSIQFGERALSGGENGTEFAHRPRAWSGRQFGERKRSFRENGTEYADTSQRKSSIQFGERKFSVGENGTEYAHRPRAWSGGQFGERKRSFGENGTEYAHTSRRKSSVDFGGRKPSFEDNGAEFPPRKLSRAENGAKMARSGAVGPGKLNKGEELGPNVATLGGHSAQTSSGQTRSKSVISVTLNNLKDHVMHSKRKKRRLLGKKGGLKVKALHVEQKGGRYFTDLFTTLVDSDWRWIILIFASCFVGCWLLFGLLWLAVAKSRNLDECIENVDSFASALLFSIETQSTIGYGGRAVTPSCPHGIVLLIAQSLIGLLMSAFLLGLVFTKLARPSRRADTLLFSKNALIAPRDGRLCLLFRVGDIRESRILDAQIRVQLFRTRHTAEGHAIPFYQQDLKCGIDWSDKGFCTSTLFLILPLTIVHVIDEESPFYEMGPEDFNSKADFEVVAILEGVIESTSMLVEARTSYLGDEIFWGRDFAQVLHENCWDDHQGRYFVDFSLFHDSIAVEIPLVSAKEFYSRLSSNPQEDDEVKRIIRKARANSRRILSGRTPYQEKLAKQYTDLWKRKFTSIPERERKNSTTIRVVTPSQLLDDHQL